MNPFDFDGVSLKQDLLDYYGTAAFNGYPAAMMDVFSVERMDSNQLWERAVKNGFSMDKYTSNDVYSVSPVQTYYSNTIPYVPINLTSSVNQSKESTDFPVYSNVIQDSFFEVSEEARSIFVRKSPGWEHALLRQEVKDFSYQLGKLKKQTPINPFVSAIGNESNGRNMLFYIVAFVNALSDGITSAQNIASSCVKNLNSQLAVAKRSNNPDVVKKEAIKLMKPYCIFLGMLNDLMTIEQPADFRLVFSELKKPLKSLLSDCEMFYFYIYSPKKDPTGTESINYLDVSLELHGFYTKKISDSVLGNREKLNQSKIKRMTF